MKAIVALVLAAVLLWAQGMATTNRRAERRRPLPPGMKAPVVELVDIAQDAGLGAGVLAVGAQAQKYIVETTGNGVAILDFDQDGLLDIFLPLASDSVDRMGPRPQKLYRNLGNLKFEEVTASSGIPLLAWAQGACAGDFDQDGRTDLLVTQWGTNVLLRNEGGRFTDQSGERLPKAAPRWSTGCAFLDYDRDGDLDLFIANYLRFDAKSVAKPGDKNQCQWKGVPVVCGPRGLPGESMTLYRNDAGKFTDVSRSAGVETAREYYGFTVLTADFDNDGFTDVYVACDSVSSLLFHNKGDGHFEEIGLVSGTALNEDGREQAGMGATAADFDNDGLIDIFKTNFSDDTPTLYRNLGNLQFQDVTSQAGLAIHTNLLGWGAAFIDLDHDGWKDLLYVNGHVYPDVDRFKLGETFRQPRALFWNRGDGQFHAMEGGAAITTAHASRGLATADFDNDGTLEAVVVNLQEGPSLLRNRTPDKGNWLIVDAPIGSQVRVTAGHHRQLEEVRSGGFHISSGDPRVHFGLGKAQQAQVMIRWPDGRASVKIDTAVNRILKVRP
jgi:hypothetical protein